MRAFIGNQRNEAILKISLPVGLFSISPYIINSNLVFIFLMPLLYSLYTKDLKIVIIFALSAALASCAIVLSPVAILKPGLYLLGTAVASSFIAIFVIASASLMRSLKGSIVSIFIPCIVWLGLLYVWNFNSIAVSIFDIGVLFPMSAPLIWFTGSIGLTALILLFQSAVAAWLVRKDAISFFIASSLAAVFLAAFIFSSVSSPASLHDRPEPERVALIQGGLPVRSAFGYKDNFNARIARYLELSARAGEYKPDIVIWPEYTFPVDIISRFPEQARPVLDAVKRSGRIFVIGTMLDDPDNKAIHYDGALILSKDGAIADTYYSSRPLTIGNIARPPEKDKRLYAGGGGITVCWEEANEKIFRDYARAGAEYFISLSSNVDLDNSWLKKYASFFTRARAAENARYIARSTQTGITQIVGPYGKVLAKAVSDKPLFLSGYIYKVRTETFYSAHGDIFARIFLFTGIILLGVKAFSLLAHVKKAVPREA